MSGELKLKRIALERKRNQLERELADLRRNPSFGECTVSGGRVSEQETMKTNELRNATQDLDDLNRAEAEEAAELLKIQREASQTRVRAAAPTARMPKRPRIDEERYHRKVNEYMSQYDLTQQQARVAVLRWEFGCNKTATADYLGLHRSTVEQHEAAVSKKHENRAANTRISRPQD
jgi:hypothetical protein